MQGIFQKENTDKALKYGIYRHLPTYEKIIRNLVSFSSKKKKKLQVSAVAQQVEISPSTIFRIMKNIKYPSLLLFQSLMILWNQKKAVPTNLMM